MSTLGLGKASKGMGKQHTAALKAKYTETQSALLRVAIGAVDDAARDIQFAQVLQAYVDAQDLHGLDSVECFIDDTGDVATTSAIESALESARKTIFVAKFGDCRVCDGTGCDSDGSSCDGCTCNACGGKMKDCGGC